MYDIIGDIHGHAAELHALLAKLGYRQRGGAYRHPNRTAAFVGDFVDRGPEQVETVMTVRRMVEAGSAVAIMGNHELNAIAYHTPDPANPGDYLRPHHSEEWGDRNRRQHAAFLAEVEGDNALHSELIDWFLTLPLWLELNGVRLVHACWHGTHMETLSALLDVDNRLSRELMVDLTQEGTEPFRAVECLTKGLEIPLPDGHSFEDKDGVERHNARIRWWDAAATTYRAAALVSDALRPRLPEEPVPAEMRVPDPGDAPIFVGHYWQRGRPAPWTETVACVDYSAGLGEALVAYRWDGEPTLTAEKFATSRD